MRKNVKIGLGCGTLFLMAIVTIAVYGFLNYKFFSSVFVDIEKDIQKLFDENDPHPDVCLNEYVRQMNDCSEMNTFCHAGAIMFGSTCLQYVEVPENYCDDVPGRMSMVDGRTWGRQRCTELNATNLQCQNGMMQMVVDFCHPVGGVRLRRDIDSSPFYQDLEKRTENGQD